MPTVHCKSTSMPKRNAYMHGNKNKSRNCVLRSPAAAENNHPRNSKASA